MLVRETLFNNEMKLFMESVKFQITLITVLITQRRFGKYFTPIRHFALKNDNYKYKKTFGSKHNKSFYV